MQLQAARAAEELKPTRLPADGMSVIMEAANVEPRPGMLCLLISGRGFFFVFVVRGPGTCLSRLSLQLGNTRSFRDVCSTRAVESQTVCSPPVTQWSGCLAFPICWICSSCVSAPPLPSPCYVGLWHCCQSRSPTSAKGGAGYLPLFFPRAR